MFAQYERVIAARDLSVQVSKGTKGIILEVYKSPILGFEVEWFGDKKLLSHDIKFFPTLDVFAVHEKDIEKDK